ncbi:MAG TPA: hypothetical protein VIV40_27780, partial [Kofleriaceae bacterium]
RVSDWCRPRSSKPMMLCESSGMASSILVRFRQQTTEQSVDHTLALGRGMQVITPVNRRR